MNFQNEISKCCCIGGKVFLRKETSKRNFKNVVNISGDRKGEYKINIIL